MARFPAVVEKTSRAVGRHPEHAFAIVALCFGVAFSAVTPPLYDKDARSHLLRVYLLAEGRLGFPAEGDAPPAALQEFAVVPGQRGQAPRHAPYPPVAYAGQAVAAWIALAADLSPAAGVRFARAGNLLTWLAATWLSLRIIPIRRWALLSLALTPGVLYQASTVGADPATNATAFVFVALALRAILANGARMSRGEGFCLVVAAALLSLTKPGYWPLAALVALIPRDRFSGPGWRLGLAVGVLAAISLPGLAWAQHVWDVGMPQRWRYTDPQAQLDQILAQPLRFASVLVASLDARIPHLLESGFGVQQHHQVVVPRILQVAHPFALVLLCLADGPEPERVTPGLRVACIVLFVLCAVSVATLAYLYWNRPGADAITGVNGRYLVPAAPLLLLAVPALRAHFAHWLLPGVALGFSITALTATVVVLFLRYP